MGVTHVHDHGCLDSTDCRKRYNLVSNKPIEIKAKGELVSNIKDVLPKTAYTLETEALGMYKVPKQPKPFQANGSVVLLTARPAKGVDKSTFNRAFEEDLAKQRVQVCIEYSASDDRLIRWLTYRKVEIDVVSM
jgi:hypothetical protein